MYSTGSFISFFLYASLPLSLFLSLSLPGSTSFFINAVFRECSSAQSPQHTSDIWLVLICRFFWRQSVAVLEEVLRLFTLVKVEIL